MDIYKNISLKNLDGEVWADIKGYEGLYLISSIGRVKSMKKYTICRWGRKQLRSEKIKKQTLETNNYLRVMLHKDGVRKMYSINQLVAINFIPNPENKPQVNHIKGITTDNRVTELEWNTSKENINHSFKVLKRVPNTLGKFGGNHIASKKVECTTLGIVYDSLSDASNSLGVHVENISMVCKNIRVHTQGLVFRYA